MQPQGGRQGGKEGLQAVTPAKAEERLVSVLCAHHHTLPADVRRGHGRDRERQRQRQRWWTWVSISARTRRWPRPHRVQRQPRRRCSRQYQYHYEHERHRQEGEGPPDAHPPGLHQLRPQEAKVHRRQPVLALPPPRSRMRVQGGKEEVRCQYSLVWILAR